METRGFLRVVTSTQKVSQFWPTGSLRQDLAFVFFVVGALEVGSCLGGAERSEVEGHVRTDTHVLTALLGAEETAPTPRLGRAWRMQRRQQSCVRGKNIPEDSKG